MTIADFDNLDINKKKELLFNCCGSSTWVKEMLSIFPVNDLVDLLEYAEEKWYDCNPADWLEAFQHYPKIGDMHLVTERYAKTADYIKSEQAGISDTPDEVLEELMQANAEYEELFGYIFIVFATGKSAEEMLEILKERINNDPREEIMIAAAEQDKITKLRLKKLFD
ncbi:MAG: 2-oxo-4-hydroxy-4-carboxy-5-ureidoimidazoline decarboxylase [Ginsengibacter sp.]